MPRIGKEPIFLPESIALEAFALLWPIKGRADRMAVGIAKGQKGKEEGYRTMPGTSQDSDQQETLLNTARKIIL